MAAEGTFEPCEKGTNDPAVQRSLAYGLMSPAETCLFSKSVNAKKHYLEGLNKALSNVTEHQISLQKSSKDNNID